MKEFRSYKSGRRLRNGNPDKDAAATIFAGSFYIIIVLGILFLLSFATR